MSVQIEEALAALGRIDVTTEFAWVRVAPIRLALEAAQQEAEAWEVIERWNAKVRGITPLRVEFSGPWVGSVPAQLFECTFPRAAGGCGATRLEALIKAAAWCRAELA